MKLLTEKEIEEMAIATSKHMYQEMPCSRLSDNEKSYQFKDGFHIGARNGYIKGAQETQKLLLESASEGFGEFWGANCEDNGYGINTPNFSYIQLWQASSLANAKKMQEKDEEIEAMKIKLNTCKNDYWFMINLIEKYGSDKEQTLKDCLERMKFRKPMLNLSETPNSSKEGV